jgi:hypothetical protein
MRSQVLLFLMIFILFVSAKSNADLNSSVQAVERARNAIAKAETVVSQIPADSAELDYVVQLLTKTSEDWDMALSSFNDARICSEKIMKTSNESLLEDYQALFTVSKQLTETHANAVIVAASYIRLVASNNLDQLENIRKSIQEIYQVKQLVRDNAEYTKKAIAEKYQ